MKTNFQNKPTILIDLDGVLNIYNGNYKKDFIPELKIDSIEFLKELHDKNKYKLVLFTSRNLLLTAKWLIKNKIDKYFEDITNIKIPALIQIDDKTICFNGDFNNLIDKIESFKPWYK